MNEALKIATMDIVEVAEADDDLLSDDDEENVQASAKTTSTMRASLTRQRASTTRPGIKPKCTRMPGKTSTTCPSLAAPQRPLRESLRQASPSWSTTMAPSIKSEAMSGE